jgi:cysteine synthase A
MKVVPALHIISVAIERGIIREFDNVYETSSGTMALGMAMACRVFNLRCVIVSDPAIDEGLAARLRLLGADLHIMLEPNQKGGFQAARLQRLDELRTADPGPAFWLRQYDNENNALSYGPVADYLASEIPNIAHLVACTGSGGSGSGLIRRLRERGHSVEFHAVDTPGSVLFGQADRPRLLRGLGNSLIPKNLEHRAVDRVHWVPAVYAFDAARRLYRDFCCDVGPTSGAAYLVGRYVAECHKNEDVVVIGADSGERYRMNVLSESWLACNGLLVDSSSAEPRDVLTPNEGGDEWAMLAWRRRSLEEVVSVAWQEAR